MMASVFLRRTTAKVPNRGNPAIFIRGRMESATMENARRRRTIARPLESANRAAGETVPGLLPCRPLPTTAILVMVKKYTRAA